MNAAITRPAALEAETPIDAFSDCHAGLLAGLRTFTTLPPLHAAALRARQVAQGTLKLMDDAVLVHHAEEEEVLFPAVLRSAEPGEEHNRVQTLIWRLTDEHREIEDLWKHLRAEVVRVADGRTANLPQEAVNLLVGLYRQHAGTEERDFLPLAQDILGRNDNHMAALGLSLHMRHRAVPVGYI
jgi:iron-sulfur cluster repair protein YtfE (RIC family)